MSDESTPLAPEGIDPPNETPPEDNAGSLVIARDLLPDAILIFPLYDRHMFPKMMGPIIIDNPQIQKIIFEAQEQSRSMYLGLLLVRPTEDTLQHVPESAADFFPVGVVARIIRISPPTEDAPLQVLVQALERFDVGELTIGKTFVTARVHY